MENKGVFNSPQGDVSSKRVAGFVFGGLGIVSMLYGGFAGNALMVDVGTTFLIAAGGLLGVGVLEHIGK